MGQIYRRPNGADTLLHAHRICLRLLYRLSIGNLSSKKKRATKLTNLHDSCALPEKENKSEVEQPIVIIIT